MSCLTLRRPQTSPPICPTPLNRLSQRSGCSDQMLAACAFSPRSEPWHSVTFCLLSDATVHPPVSKTHPYENLDPASMPPDMGYGCKMVDGVMHVYTTRKTMEKWDLYDGSLSARMLYLVVLGVEGFLSVFKQFFRQQSFLFKFWCC